MSLPQRWRQGLHPVSAVPAAPPWNLPELADLLPPRPLCASAVLVGLREHGRGTTVVLTRRQMDLRQHGGQISFPGGRIDVQDGGPLAAALRETREEIGVAAAAIEPLGWLDPYATLTGFHVLPLVARIDPDILLEPNPQEVAEVLEVPLELLLDPAQAHDHVIEWRGRRRQLVEFRWHGHSIWGATAAILVNLRQRFEPR